jgi:TetR/AcrR family tetracycline transcriptional repressor
MREDNRQKKLARIEEMQRQSQARMAQRQARVNERFAKMRERVVGEPGEPSDSQQRIIDAALELLKHDGLNNLSLRRLAGTLGMQAPALYWHFKSKEVLIDYMAEAILRKKFENIQPRRNDESWQDWLARHMKLLRQAMLAYPDGARVVAGAHLYPAVSLAELIEAGMVSLHSAGIDLDLARQIVVTANSYTFGYVIEEQAAPTEQELAKIDLDTFLAPYPIMAKALGDIQRSQVTRDKDFLSGLQLIMRGSISER